MQLWNKLLRIRGQSTIFSLPLYFPTKKISSVNWYALGTVAHLCMRQFETNNIFRRISFIKYLLPLNVQILQNCNNNKYI